MVVLDINDIPLRFLRHRFSDVKAVYKQQKLLIF